MIPTSYKILKSSGNWESWTNLKPGDKVLSFVDGQLCSQEITSLTKTGVTPQDKLYHFYNKNGFHFTINGKNVLLTDKLKTGNYTTFTFPEVKWHNTVLIPVSAQANLKQYVSVENAITDEQLELITYMLAAGDSAEGIITVHCYNNSNAVDRFEELCNSNEIHYYKTKGDDFGKETLVYYQLIEDKNVKELRSYCKYYHPDDWQSKAKEWVSKSNYDLETIPDFVEKLSVRQANIMLNTWLTIAGKAGDYWELEANCAFGEELLAYLGIITGHSVAIASGRVYLFNRDCRLCTMQVVDKESSEVSEVWGLTLSEDDNMAKCCVMTPEGWTFWANIKANG